MKRIRWPEGKAFAFTIFDDTDLATLANIRPVYDLLAECGMRTTKSVWPLNASPLISSSRAASPLLPVEEASCEDKDYLDWLLGLKRSGFEIGYHMAARFTSSRETTIRGLNRFEELFGGPPSAMANHSDCEENIYWGSDRLSGLRRIIYNLATRFRFDGRYRGHVESDPLFWGDLCHDKITYVRNFVFKDINTLNACPIMPYHDPQRPFVPFWFASSEGPEIKSFNRCLSEENQDRLEAEGGACIMYTHFGAGFCRNGRLDNRFETLIKRLTSKNGWFVPVSDLLDFLRRINETHTITNRERSHLEWTWLKHKLRAGRS
ncbi:MAG: hypothetical protein KOO62_11510 [candidate division Zixibacteria bacterium]|nr:hypothetical protein [candidate division Zixibacteria bacterium]